MDNAVKIEALRSYYGEDGRHYEAGRRYTVKRVMAEAWAKRGRAKVIGQKKATKGVKK